jgi:non-structural maintenance of chromosomes element 1
LDNCHDAKTTRRVSLITAAMSPSSDVRKLFIQSILSRGVVSEKLARAVWKKCNDAVSGLHDVTPLAINFLTVFPATTGHEFSENDESWDTFIKSVNDVLDIVSMEFHSSQDEVDGRRIFYLVRVLNRIDNTVSDFGLPTDQP